MKATRYEQVADKILTLIQNGILKEGDRLPSMRQLSGELGVSINTIKEAYWTLEKQNYIEAVPQSGFYVMKNIKHHDPSVSDPSLMDPQQVGLCQIYGAFQNSGKYSPELNLGLSNINPDFWPTDKLGKYMHEALRYHNHDSFSYIMSPGYPELRNQVSRLSLSGGMDLNPDEIIITNGCHEAIFLALMTVCKPGDTVIYESPIYFSSILLIQRLNLKLIEINASEKEGINLDTLKFVLDNHPVKAMFTISNFNNPLGFAMPDTKKMEMVALLEKYNVTLIEDDIYGDLYFDTRPSACKSFDRTSNVIHCSSITKTVSPGLRIGWIAPGEKYFDEICRLKTLLNISSGSINQIAAARFLKEGGYERHMRKLREALKQQVAEVRGFILEHFPEGTKVTDPGGGSLLWISLPEGIDSLDIYHQALKKNILIAPGCLFSMKQRYNNCLRLNAGHWNDKIRKAIVYIGKLCREYNPDYHKTDEKEECLRAIVE
ncbi:MAG: GntR family transcriptional regulator [Spirochaetae bacterium HGW-Spirochaetae-5]|nr:MAG: GntR family transcriptional regulator [Spirochaetae bacterium HGW-Spirochaetae-5]